jgi:plastin-3
MGRTTYASDSGAQHSYSLAEKVAFADYLNQYLADDPDLRDVLPINPNTDDLFKVASQGLLLWYAAVLLKTDLSPRDCGLLIL